MISAGKYSTGHSCGVKTNNEGISRGSRFAFSTSFTSYLKGFTVCLKVNAGGTTSTPRFLVCLRVSQPGPLSMLGIKEHAESHRQVLATVGVIILMVRPTYPPARLGGRTSVRLLRAPCVPLFRRLLRSLSPGGLVTHTLVSTILR